MWLDTSDLNKSKTRILGWREYKVFSPPCCSSFKFEFAMKNLLGIPWNVKSTLRSLYHKLTLIQELVINQLPCWDYYLQGKYGHYNTQRFVRQFKRFLSYSFLGILSYSRMVGPNGVPARPWLMLILKKIKTGLVSFWWRAWYTH